MTGYVAKLIKDGGFGFIRSAEDGLSRFMHFRDVMPPQDFERMFEGQLVEFETVDMGEVNPAMKKGNGLRATKIQPRWPPEKKS